MKRLETFVIGGALLLVGSGLAEQSHAFASARQGAHPSAMHKQILATEKNNRYLFAPAMATVKVGTTVTWKNTSDAPHTVTGKGSWKSYNKSLPQGGSVSFVFKKPGTYHYYCAIHPYMVASVVVTR